MALLDEKTRGQVGELLDGVEDPVKLVLFTQGTDALECDACDDTHKLVEEIASLSEKVSVEVHDFKDDSDVVKQYRVDKIPAVAMVGAKDYGVRYYGIPSGYEFGSFLQDIVQVSKGDSGLAPESRELLSKLKEPVHLQVFVTPT